MTELVWNPVGIDDFFLQNLNLSFGQWGDERTFDWCFRRPVGGRMADLMVLRRDGEILAGSAVTYAKMRGPSGEAFDIASMTGSWTVPAARGQGCFTRIFWASVERARERNCALLIGYLADKNRSRSTFVKAGASLLPTGYFIADTAAPGDNPPPLSEPATPEQALKAYRLQTEASHYLYTDGEWMGQLVKRPNPVEIIRINRSAIAILERSIEQDRVIALYSPDDESYLQALTALRNQSAAHGRILFTFAVKPSLVAALRAQGYAMTPGSVFGYPTHRDHARALEQPAEISGYAWPYGPWHAVNGDRM